MARRVLLLTTSLVLVGLLTGCGLLVAPSESSSANVEVVVPERDYPENIPTPADGAVARRIDRSSLSEGGGDPGDGDPGSGAAGGGDGTSERGGSGDGNGGDGSGDAGTSTGTARRDRPTPTTLPPPTTVPIPVPTFVEPPPPPPPPTTTTTTISPRLDDPDCVAMKRFVERSTVMAFEGVSASTTRLRELVDDVLRSMDDLQRFVPERVIAEVVNQDWLLVQIAIAPTPRDARIGILIFIDAKRDSLAGLFDYMNTTCPGLMGPGLPPRVPDDDLARDYWDVR